MTSRVVDPGPRSALNLQLELAVQRQAELLGLGLEYFLLFLNNQHYTKHVSNHL